MMGLRGQKGFGLAASVMLLALISILFPLLYNLTDRETKWAVDGKDTAVAKELASAGIDRALWKLKETNNHWVYLQSTGPLTGYIDDVEYTDVGYSSTTYEGSYRVSITTTSNADQLLIVSTAKDKKSNVYAAVQAYAVRTQISAALHGSNLVNSTTTAGEFTIHWGPIYDVGNLTLNSASINQLYPRKFAAGSIVVMGTGTYANRDTSPAYPNTDDLEYYSYYTVPPIVTPDFDYYQNIAEANGTYFENNITTNNGGVGLVTPPGQVYFFEGDARFNRPDKFIQGIVIVRGDCTFQGDTVNVSTPFANNYTTTPHATAYLEYQVNTPANKSVVTGSAVPDSVAANEYPGDTGYRTVGSHTFGTTTGGATGKRPSFRGFVYCGGNLDGGNTNAQVIHGALALSKTSEINSGRFEIFYDPTLSIRTAASEIYISDWEEIDPTIF